MIEVKENSKGETHKEGNNSNIHKTRRENNIHTSKLNSVICCITDNLTLPPYLLLESSLLGFTTHRKEKQSLFIYDKILNLQIKLIEFLESH